MVHGLLRFVTHRAVGHRAGTCSVFGRRLPASRGMAVMLTVLSGRGMGRVILLGGGRRGRSVGRMILLGSRSGMGAMHRVVLRGGGYRYQRGGDEEQRVHHASPVSGKGRTVTTRSEAHTSELQSLMRITYAVFSLKKKTKR